LPDEPDYEVNPLGLILKDSVFYLVCTLWEYANPNLLTLHRIHSATVKDIPSVVPEDFDLDEYIAKGELNFAVRGEIQLKARVDKWLTFHLQERPLDDDQVLEACDDGHYILTANTQDTNELRWWILRLGKSIEVLEPLSLRSDLADLYGEMAEKYADSTSS